MNNKYFILTLNAKPLFNIEKTFIDFFYRKIRTLSKAGTVILCTDLNYNNAVKLSSEIGLENGFIITSCGSSIFDIKNKKQIYTSYIKKKNLFPIIRQSLVMSNSIVLHSKDSLFVNTTDNLLKENVKNNNENINYLFSNDYNDTKKFIRNHNIEYIEFYNHNFDRDEYLKNDEVLKDVSKNESLSFNRLFYDRIIITSNNFQTAINEIIKTKKEDNLIYHIKLTNIFKDQIIDSNVECGVEYNLDFLFKNRTFYMFESSLQKSLVANNIETEE